MNKSLSMWIVVDRNGNPVDTKSEFTVAFHHETDARRKVAHHDRQEKYGAPHRAVMLAQRDGGQ